ncbi:MAG: hypothetical protein PHV05_13125 [Candidatus Riflebacteria bacterium]|nr:hypothetical protein [Candidatus Riflebacteria bacterium]
MMLKTDEIRLAEVRTIRRRILQTLHVTGAVGMNEESLKDLLHRVGHIITEGELRNHLDYLEEQKTIKIIDRDQATWAAKILPYGAEIIEYAAKPPAGIAKG